MDPLRDRRQIRPVAPRTQKYSNETFPPYQSNRIGSITTSLWTDTTKRRYTVLKLPHPDHDKVAKVFFATRSVKSRTEQLVQGTIFPSFTVVTGDSPLKQKIRTQFVSVASIMDDKDDPEAEGEGVILGSSSNRVNRVDRVFILDKHVGKQHAVILRADTVPLDRRGNYLHGPKFTAADAPALELFFAANSKNEKHMVALPPIVHPNNWGSDDVASGKIDDNTIQNFGELAGTRGAAWLHAEMQYSNLAMAAILTNKNTLEKHLPKIVMTRMFNGRLEQVGVGPNNEDRIEFSSSQLDARLTAVLDQAGDSIPGVINTSADSSRPPSPPSAELASAKAVEKKRTFGSQHGHVPHRYERHRLPPPTSPRRAIAALTSPRSRRPTAPTTRPRSPPSTLSPA